MTPPAPASNFVSRTTRRRSGPLAAASIVGCILATAACVFLAITEFRDEQPHWLSFAAFCALALWFALTGVHEVWRASRPVVPADGAAETTVSVPADVVDRVCEEGRNEVEAIKLLRTEYPDLRLVDAKNFVQQRWPE